MEGRVVTFAPYGNDKDICTDEAASNASEPGLTFRPVIVAPTYNNAGSLLDVLRRMAEKRRFRVMTNAIGGAEPFRDWRAPL